jgi:hypothetical protein
MSSISTASETPEVSAALAAARAELTKLREAQQDADRKHRVNQVLNQSIMFADNVLKRLVGHTLDVRPEDIFDTCLDDVSKLCIEDKTAGKKYLMYLDIVDKDYMLDLGIFHGNGDVQDRMVFLLNCVKVLYCTVKDYMKTWAVENDTDFNYVLQIGLNTTNFLDKDIEKRIGIRLVELDELA